MSDDLIWLDYVAAFGSAGAGLAAVATLCFAYWAMRNSERAADAAEQSVAVATASTDEAVRSRIDSSASMVTLIVGPTDGPYLLSNRDRMPGGGEARLWDSVNVHSSQDAVDVEQPMSLDVDSAGLLYFRTQSLLKNEGSTSAWIRPSGENHIVGAPNPLVTLSPDFRPDVDVAEYIGEPDRLHSYPHPQWILEPGQTAVLETFMGKSLGQWVKAHNNPQDIAPQTCYATVDITDPRHRFLDHIYLTGNGRPLEPASGPAQWNLTEVFGMGIREVRRTYISLGETTGVPPWVESAGTEN